MSGDHKSELSLNEKRVMMILATKGESTPEDIVKEAMPARVKDIAAAVGSLGEILDEYDVEVGPKPMNDIVVGLAGISGEKEEALKAYAEFVKSYEAKYPKVVECLTKDADVLFTFYDFPAEHWLHIRTTNPIESTFATVRHRTRQTKGCGSRTATLTMVFKLAKEAERHWRRLNGHKLIAKLIEGVKFVDGVEEMAA